METIAGLIVLLGAAVIFVAIEFVDDLFLIGIFSRLCRRWTLTWMRRSILAMIAGAALVVLGITLLNHVR